MHGQRYMTRTDPQMSIMIIYNSVIIFGQRFAFFTHISEKKTHILKICALKKRNDFRQLKRSNFRVEKCKTEENLSEFLNNMAYKTVTYMRDCAMKRNKSCVKSCQKTLL